MVTDLRLCRLFQQFLPPFSRLFTHCVGIFLCVNDNGHISHSSLNWAGMHEGECNAAMCHLAVSSGSASCSALCFFLRTFNSTIKSSLQAVLIWKKWPVPEKTHLCAMNATPTEENLQSANCMSSRTNRAHFSSRFNSLTPLDVILIKLIGTQYPWNTPIL